MKVDGQRNLLGRIDESELFILEHIKAKDVFTKHCHKAPSFSCGDIRQLF